MPWLSNNSYYFHIRFRQHPLQFLLKLALCRFIAMHQANLFGLAANTFDKAKQIGLISMGRIPSNSMNPGAYGETPAIQLHITVRRTIFLNSPSRCTGSLVPHKQHIMAWIMQHRFQIIDYPTAATHTTGGNHHGRAPRTSKVSDCLQMLLSLSTV